MSPSSTANLLEGNHDRVVLHVVCRVVQVIKKMRSSRSRMMTMWICQDAMPKSAKSRMVILRARPAHALSHETPAKKNKYYFLLSCPATGPSGELCRCRARKYRTRQPCQK